MGSALALAAAAWLAVASPALAVPREEPVGSASLTAPRIFIEILAWLGQWLDGVPGGSLSALVGQTDDPTLEPSPPGDPPPDGGGGASTQGGGAIDPDG